MKLKLAKSNYSPIHSADFIPDNLVITFITTFGVKANMHSGIVQNEVCLEQLFV